MKLKLRKGDKVVVRTGKDRNEHGVIQRVIGAKTDHPRIIVEGLNMCRKHVKPIRIYHKVVFGKENHHAL